MVCVTKSTRLGGRRFAWDSEKPAVAGIAGDAGGDSAICCWPGVSFSKKNEYDMSFEMQSKLAICSFSFPVSQAKRNGSNISRGLSPPCPALTMVKALSTASFRGCDRLASLEAAIVSNADEISTTDTVFPFDMVRLRLCPARTLGLGKDSEVLLRPKIRAVRGVPGFGDRTRSAAWTF